jgi:hypothetical protein
MRGRRRKNVHPLCSDRTNLNLADTDAEEQGMFPLIFRPKARYGRGNKRLLKWKTNSNMFNVIAYTPTA